MNWWLAVDSGLGKGLEDEVSSVCFLWFSGPRIWGIQFTIDVPLFRFVFYGGSFLCFSLESSNLAALMDSAYPMAAFFSEMQSWQDGLTFI